MIKVIKNKLNLTVSKFRSVINGAKRSSKWSSLEKKFLQKHSKCEICSSTNHLQVHHIKPFHLYPELELDENNLITLCMGEKECHLLIAHGDSFRCYNPNLREHVEILQKDISQFTKITEEAKKIRVKS
jgi:hypothetical protein